MTYLTITLGVGVALLLYLLFRMGKKNALLEERIEHLEFTLDKLEEQNELLTKAVKSYSPDYDVDELFKGGF